MTLSGLHLWCAFLTLLFVGGREVFNFSVAAREAAVNSTTRVARTAEFIVRV